jgi:hypothetical protein
MKYLKTYENMRILYRPIITDILVDIISDGISVTVHDSNEMFGEYEPPYVNVVLSKREEEDNPKLLYFDINKYKEDYLQLINYMENEGYSFNASLFLFTPLFAAKYSEGYGHMEFLSTNPGQPRKYHKVTFDNILDVTQKKELGPMALMLKFKQE